MMTIYDIIELHWNQSTDCTNMVYFLLDPKLQIKWISPDTVYKIHKISEI